MGIVPALEKARLYRGRGGELMRQAACRVVESLALTKADTAVKAQVCLLVFFVVFDIFFIYILAVLVLFDCGRYVLFDTGGCLLFGSRGCVLFDLWLLWSL